MEGYSLYIFLIDLFRLLVYPKVNSIDFKMKRERFADIYLLLQDEKIDQLGAL